MAGDFTICPKPKSKEWKAFKAEIDDEVSVAVFPRYVDEQCRIVEGLTTDALAIRYAKVMAAERRLIENRPLRQLIGDTACKRIHADSRDFFVKCLDNGYMLADCLKAMQMLGFSADAIQRKEDALRDSPPFLRRLETMRRRGGARIDDLVSNGMWNVTAVFPTSKATTSNNCFT
jgi:hypothetical protein